VVAAAVAAATAAAVVATAAAAAATESRSTSDEAVARKPTAFCFLAPPRYSPRRFLRARPASRASNTAFGRTRSNLATRPIGQGMTR